MIPSRNVVNIINNTLNLVDPRLINHGGRVAGHVYQVLRARGGMDAKALRDVCLLAVLHDIGAYKTEEIDRMVEFETEDVWSHSIYGFLFLKYLSPLTHLAPVLFFHHASVPQLRHCQPEYHDLAQIIHIADRLDIMTQIVGGVTHEAFRRHFLPNRGVKYREDLVDLFESVFFSPGYVEQPFEEVFDALTFTDDELNAYLTMVVLSIDFRSTQTVTHTVTATTVASALAELMGMSKEEADRVYLGTMLHDLGKQGIPPEILEAPGKLSPKAMDIMRSHVGMTEGILDGNVDDRVFNIAIHHHEKLNGSGYPRGIRGEYLGMTERLATVADILSALVGVRSYKDSFPREKVTAILGDMAAQGEVDPEIVEVACDNYDYVMNKVTKTARRVVGIYNHMNHEFDHFKEQSVRYGTDDSLGYVLE